MSAQSGFSIPSSWRKPGFVNSPQEQITKARAEVAKNLQNLRLSPHTTDPAVLCTQLAQIDQLSGQPPQYSDTTFTLLNNALNQNPSFEDELAYGYAALEAYRTYNYPRFLQMAQAAGEFGNNYTISPAQATAKSLPTKDITLAQQCRSASLAGGTFFAMDRGSPLVGMIASGSFLIISSLLANETGNSTYHDAAINSYQFITAQLFTNSTTLSDGINVDSCSLLTPGGIADSPFFMEGTAVLAAVTKNSTLQNLASELVQTAITKASQQNPQGILNNDNTSGGGEEGIGRLVRALASVYNLNSDDTALRNYIRAFIAVQYNALVDLAGSDDIYSGSWSGPPPSNYEYDDGIAAGDLLLAGLAIGNETSSTFTPSKSNPTSPPSSPSPMNKSGAIAGGAVGGIALIALLALLLLLIRRRRRYSAVKATAMMDIDGSTLVRGTVSTTITTTFRAETIRIPDRLPRQVGTRKQPPNLQPSTVSPGAAAMTDTDDCTLVRGTVATASLLTSTSGPTVVSVPPYARRSTTPHGVDQARLQGRINQPAAKNGEGETVAIQSLLVQLIKLMQQRNPNRDGKGSSSNSNPV